MKLFIIARWSYKDTADEYLFELIESVWDNRQLAEAAMIQHADEADVPTSHYTIIERNLNSIT